MQPTGGLRLSDAILQDHKAMAFLLLHRLQPTAGCLAVGQSRLRCKKAAHFRLTVGFLTGMGAQRRPIQQ